MPNVPAPRPGTHRSPELAAALAENAKLKSELAKQERQAKADQNDAEWSEAWAKVEHEEAQQRSQREQGLARLRNTTMVVLPCSCRNATVLPIEQRGAMVRCYHCRESYQVGSPEAAAHKKKHHPELAE